MKIVAFDPSITAFGWAVLETGHGRAPALAQAGVVLTEPAPKKHRTTVAEDDARRVRHIRRELAKVLEEHRPVMVAIEVPFGSQAAKAAKLLGAAQALATCLVDDHLGGRAIYVTVHEAGDALGIQRTQRVAKGEKKSAADGKKSSKARKSAIVQAVEARFGGKAIRAALSLPVGDWTHPRWEGAFDAVAVGLAAWDRPEVAAFRRLHEVA